MLQKNPSHKKLGNTETAKEQTTELPYSQCKVCSSLLDNEHACQKYGWENENTYLPVAAAQLNLVRDFQPYGSRKLQLKQCPECRTYYLYKSDYEYLVNGSEDEEILTRLTPEKAAEYLNQSQAS